ncbi:alginate lyase family protein, partial [Oceanobacillus picturae]|uniref:alginate lyase family protein n=1 Tax=Oceanobacillus picturae TaxID=171693 RepID=UPI000A990279
WHRIQFGDIYGYVSKFDTTPSTKSAIKNLNEGYKNTSRTFETLKDVTVYDNSSGSIVPFAQLDKGTNFTIAADYGSWWRVLFADRVGYVKKGEVKAEFKDGDSFFRVFREGKPVYDNRKGYLIEVSDLNKNQVYRISSDYGNWWRVQFGNDFGFVRKADTGYATIKEIRNFNQTYKNTNKKFIIANDTKVYDNTSGSLVPFGELKVGSAFPIASDYGNWWRIIYLGRIGYVNKNDSLIYREYSIEETVDQYKNKDTRNTLKRIETFFISPSSNYLLSADAMLEDKFRISDYGTFDFSNGIPWGEDPIEGKSFSRSYYRSLHAQFFINDLIAAYKETANEEYIYKGYEIINDWIINNPYTNSEHKLAWHDEGSARRLITWVNFYNEARNILEDKQLQYLLSSMTEHADILLMDSFHTTNTNHGMYQDEALIVFSDYFKDLPKSQLYNQIGKKRLKSYFDYIISEEGVHLEHSPGYHQIIAKSVKGYKNYFNLMGDYDQFNYYNQLYNSMANYYVWLVKPDGSLPLIGDTFSNVVPPDSLWEDNNYYKYAISQGEKGIKPPTHSAVFEDAGYAIFRDDWEVGSNSTYIHFTAAYHTEYHKHSDDLSLWIYANGHDIITEAGPNGYDYDLPFTEFAYSSYAHNTLIVNDKGLPRIDGKYEDTHILDYNLGERVSQVSGINNRYDNVSHQRELEYNRDDKIVKVNDKITSDKRNNYKLLWNLAEGVRPEINGNSINLFVEDVLVMNLEINSESELEIYEKKGEKDPSIIGWHFEDRNKPVETHTIVIESSEVNADIESVFTIK